MEFASYDGSSNLSGLAEDLDVISYVSFMGELMVEHVSEDFSALVFIFCILSQYKNYSILL